MTPKPLFPSATAAAFLMVATVTFLLAKNETDSAGGYGLESMK